MKTRNCKHCDSLFEYYSNKKRFCSSSCHGKFNYTLKLPPTKACVICGESFKPTGNQKTCENKKCKYQNKHNWFLKRKGIFEITGICEVCEGPLNNRKQEKFCSNACFRIKDNARGRAFYKEIKENEMKYFKFRSRVNEYTKKKLETDPEFKLASILRKRFYKTVLKVRKNSKSGLWLKMLGCTVSEFRIHIEKQFKAGMTWESHGNKTWHLDHIKPVYTFDLKAPAQVAECFHFSNIRPLWAAENLSRPRPRK